MEYSLNQPKYIMPLFKASFDILTKTNIISASFIVESDNEYDAARDATFRLQDEQEDFPITGEVIDLKLTIESA